MPTIRFIPANDDLPELEYNASADCWDSVDSFKSSADGYPLTGYGEELAGVRVPDIKPQPLVHGRIDILQWREFGDDDDSLEINILPEDAPADLVQKDIEDTHCVTFNWEDDREELPEGKSRGYIIAENSIINDEVFTSGNRRFRVNIVEIPD